MTPESESTQPGKPSGGREESVKETIISVIISFAMAFVFRSYVVEPFRIPTGSMAPTLLGAHMRFYSPVGGFTWTVNPRDATSDGRPLPLQGAARFDRDPVTVRDPMTGIGLRQSEVPLRAGDRILVLKYLYLVRPPERYDVVVFKNPETPAVNLIKRLVGLPGEEVLIVDGDVFVRPAGSGEPWSVTRKPDRVQEEVWWPLFSSDYAPLEGAVPDWRPPWTGAGWTLDGREYRFDSPRRGELDWDASVRAINDFTAYNQTLPGGHPAVAYAFPVSDLRLRARVRPDDPGLTMSLRLEARDHVYLAEIGPDGATLSLAPAGGGEPVVRETIAGTLLTPGEFTSVEFWHADQSLQLRLDGRTVLRAEYDWSADRRLELGAAEDADRIEPADPVTFASPSVSMAFEGSPVTLTGVALDRDLYYRAMRQAGRYFRASHPTYPAVLNGEQFFMLGDNSAASHDGRGWNRVDPWVGEAFGYSPGVVHRDLILGKAFMVYWPAPYPAKLPPGLTIPMPDVGRVRFIR